MTERLAIVILVCLCVILAVKSQNVNQEKCPVLKADSEECKKHKTCQAHSECFGNFGNHICCSCGTDSASSKVCVLPKN